MKKTDQKPQIILKLIRKVTAGQLRWQYFRAHALLQILIGALMTLLFKIYKEIQNLDLTAIMLAATELRRFTPLFPSLKLICVWHLCCSWAAMLIANGGYFSALIS